MYETCVYRTMDSIQEMSRKIPDVELRDLFALNAMNSIIGSNTNYNLADMFSDYKYERNIPTETGQDRTSEENLTTREWIAKASYLMADAMLKARKVKDGR